MSYKLNSKLAKDLQLYSKKVVDNKLVVGPGGNNSIRDGDIMWISPSGYSLDDINEEQWVPVHIATGKVLNSLKPSSELSMHLEIYQQRSDVNAIVHTHPPITIGIISTEEHNFIPPMFPDFVALVGEVPFIDYVVPCSIELAKSVVGVLKNKEYNALYMKNHGLITLGSNIKQAYYRTEIIEDAARIFWTSKTIGTTRILSKVEQDEILNLEAEKYRQKLLDRS